MKRNKIITFILLIGVFTYLYESEKRLRLLFEDFSADTLFENSTDILENTEKYDPFIPDMRFSGHFQSL